MSPGRAGRGSVPPMRGAAGADRLGRWPLPRGLIVLLSLACAVVILAGMRGFAGVLGPVFLALMLTIAVSSLQAVLRRRGVPRAVAMLAAIIAVYVIVAGLVVALAVSIEQLVTLLPQYADKAQDLLDGLHRLLTGWGVGDGQADGLLAHIDPQRLLHVAVDLVHGLLGAGSQVVFLFALLLFMAVDAAGFTGQLGAAARERPHIAEGLAAFAAGVRSYLLVSTVFGLIVAVLDGVALWAMAVPLPLLWALLSFITNYIPNIGFIIGLAPPALLALLDGGPSKMLLVIVVYSVINVVIQSVIQPKFVGDAVGLSVTLTFLSLVVWSWVLGPLGALLAIPLSLFVKALLIDIDPSTRWMAGMIAGSAPAAPEEPAPGPDAPERPPRER